MMFSLDAEKASDKNLTVIQKVLEKLEIQEHI